MAYAGTTFHILPIDESTVYNEMLQLLYIDKNDVKKLDTAGKSDYLLRRIVAAWLAARSNLSNELLELLK